MNKAGFYKINIDNVVDDFYSLAPKYRTKDRLKEMLKEVLEINYKLKLLKTTPNSVDMELVN